MMKSSKEVFDKAISVNAIFVDLSKASDELNPDILIANIGKSLSKIHSYLNKRLQNTNLYN